MTPSKEDHAGWFTQTSDEPYDRHQYLLQLESVGPYVVDDYELAKGLWRGERPTGPIEVLDVSSPQIESPKKKKQKPRGGGFSS
jgi:hypothetical protein